MKRICLYVILLGQIFRLWEIFCLLCFIRQTYCTCIDNIFIRWFRDHLNNLVNTNSGLKSAILGDSISFIPYLIKQGLFLWGNNPSELGTYDR